MLAKGALQNLVGGVSQQAVALRLPTQSTDELNTYPLIVNGNVKRPPTELCGVLATPFADTAFVHPIIRDKSERYVVSISGGAIRVVDFNGVEKTVNYPDGTGYLSAFPGMDATSFDAVTIADYTFIVNKNKTVAMTSEVFPVRLPEALLNVVEGNYAKTYEITVNGDKAGTFTTNAGAFPADAATLDTSYIADHLTTAITTDPAPLGYTTLLVANGWSVQVKNNWVWIQRVTGVDFTITGKDGWGGKAMKVIKGTVQSFTDLPTTAPEGFVAGIAGDTTAPDQFYYVRFVTNTNQVNNQYRPDAGSSGVIAPTTPNTALSGNWQECPMPGVKIAFDPATMPHILVREADGTFTFKRAIWDKRVCGDENSVGKPSFVGQSINSITLYKNRLTLLSGGNVIASRAGDYFNFWRTSAVTLLDDDPIDINAATRDVAILRASAPYQQSLVVFSDLAQFTFNGTELLSPKTVNFPVAASYENTTANLEPVETTRRVIFGVDRDAWTGLREYYYDVQYRIAVADDITSHVPAFIPKGAYRMTNSSIEDLLVVASSGDRSSLWLYKYLWEDQTKLQSAWFRWSFAGANILSHFFDASTLYLVVQRGGQTSLEKMRVHPDLADDGHAVTYLDRRVKSDVLAAPVYDIAMDRTGYVLPYAPATDGTFKAVTRPATGEAGYAPWKVVSIDGVNVYLDGDTRAIPFYFGETYTTRYVFSPIFVRDPQKGQVVQEGRLQLLKLAVTYQQTGYFRAEVTPPGRSTSTYEFGGAIIADALADVDRGYTVLDGVFDVPVKANAATVDIRLINDDFRPSRFVRVEWKGNFVPKSRK